MKTSVLNFVDCSLPQLDKLFGLRWVRPLPALENWEKRAAPIVLSDYETMTCTHLRNLLDLNAFYWKEQDLSLHFIGPIFSLIHFTEPYRFNLFAQRSIETTLTTVQNTHITLMGKPDEILASGYGEPEILYFAFNEFKKEIAFKGDAAGQVLSAMLVGQHLNQETKTVYGCYVLGRDWYFMALHHQHYSISRGFDGTTDDIHHIVRWLKALKQIVQEQTPNQQ